MARGNRIAPAPVTRGFIDDGFTISRLEFDLRVGGSLTEPWASRDGTSAPAG
jgi:hypothetical protein